MKALVTVETWDDEDSILSKLMDLPCLPPTGSLVRAIGYGSAKVHEITYHERHGMYEVYCIERDRGDWRANGWNTRQSTENER